MAYFAYYFLFHEDRQKLLRMDDEQYKEHVGRLAKVRRKGRINSAERRMHIALELTHNMLEKGSFCADGNNKFAFLEAEIQEFLQSDDSLLTALDKSDIDECVRIVELFLDPGPSDPQRVEIEEEDWAALRDNFVSNWEDVEERFSGMLQRWSNFGRIASGLDDHTFQDIVWALKKATQLLDQAKANADSYEATD